MTMHPHHFPTPSHIHLYIETLPLRFNENEIETGEETYHPVRLYVSIHSPSNIRHDTAEPPQVPFNQEPSWHCRCESSGASRESQLKTMKDLQQCHILPIINTCTHPLQGAHGPPLTLSHLNPNCDTSNSPTSAPITLA